MAELPEALAIEEGRALIERGEAAGASSVQATKAIKFLIDISKSKSIPVRTFSGENLPRFFGQQEDNIKEQAVDCIYDLCEDEDKSVRMVGYKAFAKLSDVALDWVKRNADVIIQLLQVEDVEEHALIRASLLAHINIAPKFTFAVISAVLSNDDSELSLKMVLVDFLVIDAESVRRALSQGKLIGTGREDALMDMKDVEQDPLESLRKGLLSLLETLSPSSTKPELYKSIFSLLLPLPAVTGTLSTSKSVTQAVNLVLTAVNKPSDQDIAQVLVDPIYTILETILEDEDTLEKMDPRVVVDFWRQNQYIKASLETSREFERWMSRWASFLNKPPQGVSPNDGSFPWLHINVSQKLFAFVKDVGRNPPMLEAILFSLYHLASMGNGQFANSARNNSAMRSTWEAIANAGPFGSSPLDLRCQKNCRDIARFLQEKHSTLNPSRPSWTLPAPAAVPPPLPPVLAPAPARARKESPSPAMDDHSSSRQQASSQSRQRLPHQQYSASSSSQSMRPRSPSRSLRYEGQPQDYTSEPQYKNQGKRRWEDDRRDDYRDRRDYDRRSGPSWSHQDSRDRSGYNGESSNLSRRDPLPLLKSRRSDQHESRASGRRDGPREERQDESRSSYSSTSKPSTSKSHNVGPSDSPYTSHTNSSNTKLVNPPPSHSTTSSSHPLPAKPQSLPPKPPSSTAVVPSPLLPASTLPNPPTTAADLPMVEPTLVAEPSPAAQPSPKIISIKGAAQQKLSPSSPTPNNVGFGIKGNGVREKLPSPLPTPVPVAHTHAAAPAQAPLSLGPKIVQKRSLLSRVGGLSKN